MFLWGHLHSCGCHLEGTSLRRQAAVQQGMDCGTRSLSPGAQLGRGLCLFSCWLYSTATGGVKGRRARGQKAVPAPACWSPSPTLSCSAESRGFLEGKRRTAPAPLISETDCEAWARLGVKVLGQCLSPVPGRLPLGPVSCRGESQASELRQAESGLCCSFSIRAEPRFAKCVAITPLTCGHGRWCKERGCFQEPASSLPWEVGEH